MSFLNDTPAPTLKLLRGRLETLETAWSMSMRPARRKQIDEEFVALADEIKLKFGDEGKKVVNDVLAKHNALHFGNGNEW